MTGPERVPVAARERVVRDYVDMHCLAAGENPGEAGGWPLRAFLQWRSEQPQAVEVTFDCGGHDVEWMIGRDLLSEGCSRPVGVGDVSVLPDPFTPGMTELVLSTDTGRTCLRFPTADLGPFLNDIEESPIPDGIEANGVEVEGSGVDDIEIGGPW